jgi:hypothetical protein
VYRINRESRIGMRELGIRDCEKGTVYKELGAGNPENWGTHKRKQGTVNRDLGIGNWDEKKELGN